MNDNRFYEEQICGKISVVDFADLELAAQSGEPELFRNQDWMVLGPFVMETDGALETEYMYRRHLILGPDYLNNDGGECCAVPYLGRRVKSDYLGGEEHIWRKGINKFGGLSFDANDCDSACDNALFLTEQRNCVFYAAVYVRCNGAKRAMLCYENSGCRIYLNGKLIADSPYGRVKGVSTMGRQVPLELNDGLNLLLFKLRPGFICDNVDFGMSNCSIWPIAASGESLALTCPSKTAVFTHADGEARQMFPCFAVAFEDNSGGTIELGSTQKIELEPMKKGECRLIRMEVDAENESRFAEVEVSVSENGKDKVFGKSCVRVDPKPRFKGKELFTTSFHFDTTYTQEQRTYAIGAIYITHEIIKEMRRDPLFKTVISEIDYLHPYYSLFPQDREFLRNAFATGQTESDCFYNQPNELTSGAEGIVRNLLYGQLYHRDVMGRICHIYSPGDVFGHFNQMSQVSAKGGCEGVSWGKHIFGFAPLFRHISPDGTHLLHKRGDLSRKAAAELDLNTCGYSSSAVDSTPGYFADGDLSWMQERKTDAQFSVPSEIHQHLQQADEARFEAEGRDRPFGLTSRDMSLYHAGVSLTRTDLKQANRIAENILISAEKFSTFAALLGANYPEKTFDKAWRQVLCGQHHDSITGTNNEISFVDLMIEYREAVELATDILDRATKFIASRAASVQGSTPITVFNPHCWARKEAVTAQVKLAKPPQSYILTDSRGNAVDFRIEKAENTADGVIAQIRFNAEVPSMGYAAYALTLGERKALDEPIEGDDTVIENEFYRICVDPSKGGGITSIFDKKNSRELIDLTVDGPGNRILALKEAHDRMETQHELYTTGHRLDSSQYKATVKSEKCSDYQRLTVKYQLGNICPVTQTITLNKGSGRIDFETRCDDYRDEDDLFCVTFPTTLKGVRPVFDDRFAPQIRNESLNSMDFRTHQYAMFSHCAVYAANQWLDYGSSITAHFGGESSVNLGMTQIIRKNGFVGEKTVERLMLALTKKAIPCTVFPDTKQSCIGSQIIHFNEDLTSDTRFVLSIEGDGNEYAEKLINKFDEKTKCEIKARLKENGTAVIFVRDSENLWSKPIDVFLALASNAESLERLIEKIESDCRKGRFIELDCLMTEQIGKADDYGIALLNTGNIACSVERGGMLNMMLFHTAEFYGNIGKANCGAKFVPERKSHIFKYSLYPHRESFREAQIYRRALELNDPLIAVCAKSGENASLPSQMSFLAAEGDAVVTALKAGGAPMAAMSGKIGTLAERGITVRCFESDGIKSESKLKFGFDVSSAVRVNLLEEGNTPAKLENNTLTVELSPYEIETVNVKPSRCLPQTGETLGAQREPIEPTYIRSWEHDLGSMPMGYLSVAASISRNSTNPDETHICTEVAVVNNYTDRGIEGSVSLELPEGWSADWLQREYKLEPNGYCTFPVTFTKPTAEAKGIIRLCYEHDGQKFFDVFEVGYFDPEFRMIYDEDGLRASVENKTSQPLMGELWVASPIETWGDANGKNPFAKAKISPYCTKVELAAGETREYYFDVSGDENLSWYAIGKLCINGRIRFSGVEKKGARHCLWAHEILPEIYANDGGSLERILILP